jgi:hypothetical protein
MAHKTDVPRNLEIWTGGPNGLRLRRHPRLAEALTWLAEYPMVIRKTTLLDRNRSAGNAPKLALGSLPVFRRSTVGETIDLRVEIDCPPLERRGAEQFARLFVETTDTTLEEHLVVRPGKRQAVLLPFPAFDRPTELTVSLALRDQPCGIVRQTATLQPEKRWTFYFAFQTHLDMGWTDRVGPTVTSLRRMTSEVAIQVCRQFMDRPAGERFIWICECSDALRLAWEGADTARREALREFIARGLIQCCAFPFSFHTGLMSRDLLRRAIDRSFALRDEIGVPALDLSVAQSNDVPGHSWIVPDVLAEKGIRRAVIGHNTMVRGCSLPALFNWRGPSGQDVLTLATRCVDYGSDFPVPHQPMDLHGLSANNPEALRLPGTAIFRGIGYGENCGPEGAEREINAIAAWNQAYAWPRLVIGGPKDYFAHIEPEIDTASLPVVDQEISDWWIDGPASTPRAMAQYRQAMFDLPRLDARIPKAAVADRRTLAEIENNLILHAEHTFGLNAQLVRPAAAAQDWKLDGLDNYVGSWEDKERYAARAFALSGNLCAKYPLQTPAQSSAGNWEIAYDDAGIVSLTDPNGSRWHDRAQQSQFFAKISQRLLEQELDEWFHHNPPAAPNAGDYDMRVTSVTPFGDGVRIEGKLDSPAGAIDRIRIALSSSPDSADLLINIEIRGKALTAQAEMLTLALPFLCDEPVYRTDVGEALLRVDADQLPDANRDEHPVISGWILEDASAGKHLGVCSAQVFLWHFGDKRYCRWNHAPATRSATAYAHLCNNVWNTNFRCWVGGDLSFSLRLVPFGGGALAALAAAMRSA